MSGRLGQAALRQVSVLTGRCFVMEATTSAPTRLPQHPARSNWPTATACSATCCSCPCCKSSNRSYTSSSSAHNSPSSSSSTPHNDSSGNGRNPSSSSSSSSSRAAGSLGARSGHSSPPSQSGRALLAEIKAVRAHIFEHHIGDGRRSGRKAILRAMKGRYIADWYFTLTGPQLPMTGDEVDEERQFKVELARATGGGPPKKGQGKRGKK